MSTKFYFSNDPSSVSGYLKLYIGGPSPNASSTVSTAVTNTADVTTTTVAMTLTAGGTAAKWISEPIKAAVTVSARPFGNVWAKESNASANAMVGLGLSQYTTSLQSAFITTSSAAELTTSIANVMWLSTAGAAGGKEVVTSTSFSAGDRVAVVPVLAPVGVMAAGGGFTVTFDYNGNTINADGDSYFVLQEDIQAGNSQYGDGDSSAIPGGPGANHYYTLRDNLSAFVGTSTIPITNESRVEDALNELLYQGQQQSA